MCRFGNHSFESKRGDENLCPNHIANPNYGSYFWLEPRERSGAQQTRTVGLIWEPALPEQRKGGTDLSICAFKKGQVQGQPVGADRGKALLGSRGS